MCISGRLGMRDPKDVAVGLRRFSQRSAQRGFAVDMHLQQLDIETVEMRNMRNKIHEVGKLAICQYLLYPSRYEIDLL